MATLVAQPASALPSLDQALSTHDFSKSRQLYNTLPEDCDQPAICDSHIQNLASLFVRHNAHHVLGIHLIHGHFTIPEDTVLLGTNINFSEEAAKGAKGVKGRWIRITPTSSLTPLSTGAAIHGHIFVFTGQDDKQLCAYEYQQGPLPDLSAVGAGFLDDFIEYLVANELTGLIGLQVLDPDCPPSEKTTSTSSSSSMYELILGDEGTVMLEADGIKNCKPTRVTGWKFEVGGGPIPKDSEAGSDETGGAGDGQGQGQSQSPFYGPKVCSRGETHAAMTSGNHKVFNSGMLKRARLEKVEDLERVLVEAGVL
ncbi:hypothetical protein B0T20DRAFT_136587 [Sordaria brevicollis]|uniref:Uncharacterized protein n=1 Tax=Sordaria brevicollis TaxID=83679 RepID=A0AAE0UFV9_SORBR|nr:hypothetical protein B0T20DRAFT_136587 [Sordaria brevicollis]